METCFTGAAAALYVLAAGRTLWRDGADGYGPLAATGALVGALLCFPVPPVWRGGVVLGCSLALTCLTRRRAELLPVQNRAVLITGCDSGFGHALATRLSDAGVQVFAGVLHLDGAGAQRLRDRASPNLQVLQLDVTDAAQIEAARGHICGQVGPAGLWGLVNNAGILPCPADAELIPQSAFRRCMDVNFLAAVDMCRVFLPALRRSRGRVVNVSSMAGEVPMPWFAAYGASKAALIVFSEVMRMELAPWGVKVVLIQPAGFKTNIFRNDIGLHGDEVLAAASPEARRDYGDAYISSLAGSLSKMSQQVLEDLSPVVDAMCHALLSVRPRTRYAPGQMGQLLLFLHRHCPTPVFDFLLARLVQYGDCEPAGLRRS